MIRIEEFLFNEEIEQSLSETLITKYPGLSFSTNEEFYSYFQSQNVRLVKLKPTNQTLLQRFKDFKSSTDYSLVKLYIKQEREIERAISSGNTDKAISLYQSITLASLDPFFDFIVRKTLTGYENGQLPSEKVKTLMDEIAKNNTQDINKDVDVIRDGDGTIQSFKNYLKNVGSLKINLVDDRYRLDSFRYVVDSSFKQLEDAVNAELNVLKKVSDLTTVGTDKTKLKDDLKKLILEDSSTIPALQVKVETLEDQVDALQELVEFKDGILLDSEKTIEELAQQRNKLVDELEVKDQTIVELNSTINTRLGELESKVLFQLENGGDAFDELSSKLEEQAKKAEEQVKKAEENAEKQLKAFEKAIGSITDSLKPKEPDIPTSNENDSPEEKRRKEKIKKIQEDWDLIKYISSSNDDYLIELLKIVGVDISTNKYKFTDISTDPNNRVKMISSWNTLYKQQFKQSMNISTIKTEADADKILSLVDKLKLTPSQESSLRKLLYADSYAGGDCGGDIFDRWRNDCNRARGVNEPIVKQIHDFVKATYQGFGSTRNIENALSVASIDTILEVFNLVNEFPGSY